MKSVFKNPLFYLSIILIIAASFTTFEFIKARTFQEPTSDPTEQGTITEPITEGSKMQVKSGSLTIQKDLIPKKTLTPLLEITGSDISVTSDGICLSDGCKRYWSQVGNISDWSGLDRVLMFSVECHLDCDNEDVDFKVGPPRVALTNDSSDFTHSIDITDETRVSKGKYTLDLVFQGDHIDSDDILSAELVKNLGDGTYTDSNFTRKLSISNNSTADKIEFGLSRGTGRRDLDNGDEIRFIIAWPAIN